MEYSFGSTRLLFYLLTTSLPLHIDVAHNYKHPQGKSTPLHHGQSLTQLSRKARLEQALLLLFRMFCKLYHMSTQIGNSYLSDLETVRPITSIATVAICTLVGLLISSCLNVVLLGHGLP